MWLKLLMLFLGYVFGRWSHVYLNVWTGDVNWWPHHWIIGLIVVVVGYFVVKGDWGSLIAWFGVGLFVNDFNDFLHFRTFQPDGDGPKRFWHID